jgi:hypothetical protein
MISLLAAGVDLTILSELLMRNAARYGSAALMVGLLALFPLLLGSARVEPGSDSFPRVSRRANNVQPVPPRGLFQQQLLGIDPSRLILIAPATELR